MYVVNTYTMCISCLNSTVTYYYNNITLCKIYILTTFLHFKTNYMGFVYRKSISYFKQHIVRHVAYFNITNGYSFIVKT